MADVDPLHLTVFVRHGSNALDHFQQVGMEFQIVERREDGVIVQISGTQAQLDLAESILSNRPTSILDPRLHRYRKMAEMNCPRGAIINAMKRNGLSPRLISQVVPASRSTRPAAPPAPERELDPRFRKYRKMLEMNVPMGAIRNAMKQKGFPEYLIDEFTERNSEQLLGSGPPGVECPPPFNPPPPPGHSSFMPGPPPSLTPPGVPGLTAGHSSVVPTPSWRRDQMRKIREALPKREHGKPDFSRPVFLRKINPQQVVQSEFWMDVLNSGYDDMLEIDAAQVKFHVCNTRKVKLDGYWYDAAETDWKSRSFHVVNRDIIEFQRGGVECILFSSRWRGLVLSHDKCASKESIYDRIVWTSLDGKSVVWKRYTNVMAMRKHVSKKYFTLPYDIVALVQHFLGDRTYKRQKEKREKAGEEHALFDSKRIQDVGFMIRLLKLTSEEAMEQFCADIRSMDFAAVTQGREVFEIGGLLPLFPTLEEEQLVSNVVITKKSSLVEKWFLAVSRLVPRSANLMRMWSFTHTFHDLASPVTYSLRTYESAGKAVLHSTSLKMMLGMVLKLANYCNSKTHLKNMYAFKLTSLSRVSRNMLEYLVLTALERFPAALEFVEELRRPLREVGRVDFANSREQLEGLRAQLRNLALDLPRHRYTHGAQFHKYMQNFVVRAEEEIDQMDAQMDLVHDLYKTLDKELGQGEFNLLGDYGGLQGMNVLEDFRERVDKIVTTFKQEEKKQETRLQQTQRRLELRKSKKERRKRAKKKDVVKKNPFDEVLKMKAKLDMQRKAKHSAI